MATAFALACMAVAIIYALLDLQTHLKNERDPLSRASQTNSNQPQRR